MTENIIQNQDIGDLHQQSYSNPPDRIQTFKETPPFIITTEKGLDEYSNYVLEFSRQNKSAAYIAIDGEWDRYSDLAVVSCKFGERRCTLIKCARGELGPDGSGKMLKGLAKILACPQIIKVFHDAIEDLRRIYERTGVVAKNIFDSSVWSLLHLYKMNYSYQNLIHNLSNWRVYLPKNKEITTSQWSDDQLTPEQLLYATDDVLYLHYYYPKMKEEMNSRALSKCHLLDVYDENDPRIVKKYTDYLPSVDPNNLPSNITEWFENDMRGYEDIEFYKTGVRSIHDFHQYVLNELSLSRSISGRSGKTHKKTYRSSISKND